MEQWGNGELDPRFFEAIVDYKKMRESMPGMYQVMAPSQIMGYGGAAYYDDEILAHNSPEMIDISDGPVNQKIDWDMIQDIDQHVRASMVGSEPGSSQSITGEIADKRSQVVRYIGLSRAIEQFTGVSSDEAKYLAESYIRNNPDPRWSDPRDF